MKNKIRKNRKQQILVLLLLFLAVCPFKSWGQWGNGSPDDPYGGNLEWHSSDIGGVLIKTSGTYYFSGVTRGGIALQGLGLNVILCFDNTNRLTVDSSPNAAMTYVGAMSLGTGAGNTVTIKSRDNNRPATLTCEGRFVEGLGTICAGINVREKNWLIIEGNISVTATGTSAVGKQAPGIGTGWKFMMDPDLVPAGRLTLRNGAYLKTDLGCNNDAQLAKLEIEGYATIAAGGDPPFTSGYPYTADFSRTDVKPGAGWKDFKTKSGISGKVYCEGNQVRLCLQNEYKPSEGTDWFELAGIMAGNVSSGNIKMGLVYDNSGNYYKSLASTNFPSGSTVYLNVNNYTYAGTYTSSGDVTLDGNGKTFYSNGFVFAPAGSGPLRLSKMQIQNQIKVQGSVYCDTTTDGIGNLLNWNVKDRNNQTVWYCESNWLEPLSNFDLWTSDREDWNDFTPAVGDVRPPDRYTDRNRVCIWLPEGANRYVNLKNNADENVVYKSAATTVTAHNTIINFTRYTAAETYNAAGVKQNAYASLLKAFKGVRKGETIRLSKNYTSYGNNDYRTSADDVTFDLNGKTLTSTVTTDQLGMGSNDMLKLINSNSSYGGLTGTFKIRNLYCDLAADKLNSATFLYGTQKVYRTLISGMPTGIAKHAGYFWNGGARYQAGLNAAGTTACVWLPAGSTPKEIQLFDGVASGAEQIATATVLVEANHGNTAAAYPYVDIQKGNVSVTPVATNRQQVAYGTASRFEATVPSLIDNRLPIFGTALSDKGQDNNITVAAGTGTAYISLSETSVKPKTKDALRIEGPADVELRGTVNLTGGVSGGTPFPAIQVTGSTPLTLRSDADGRGQLLVDGGAYGTANSPAILLADAASMTIADGTITARRSDENGIRTATGSIEGGALRIHAGSVDALHVHKNGDKLERAVTLNAKDHDVWKVAVTTGLEPGQPYNCTYVEADPLPFKAMPDAAGKLYCWLPKQPIEDAKTDVTLTHPVSFEKTTIEVAKVDENDNNVAPIVVEMIDQVSGQVSSFGNLQDAFNAMKAGTADAPARYQVSLLTRINNLRTSQIVPANTEVSLNLQSFEIATQNGSNVAFDASASGAYLNITGKGNIKNTFRLVGDVFIDGVVPLTDAVVVYDNQAVFRTLVKDLPVGQNNTYTYSYGQRQNVPFNLHDGLACLWLPDYGRSEELRFLVSGSGGSSTDYTAGGITTVTQRTEAIPASPVGVVARVTYSNGSMNNAFNTLKEAVDHARKASVEQKHADVTLHLLTGVSLSGELTLGGTFRFDLSGKNITSASGARLIVETGATIEIYDETVGMKGTVSTDIDLRGTGRLFLPGSIRLNGTVMRNTNNTMLYWRTLVNTRYLSPMPTLLGYDGADYAVIGDEACLWLPANSDNTTVYSFTANGTVHNVTGYIISAQSHANDMTIGGSNNAARLASTEYATVEEAFAALTTAGPSATDVTVELLKTSSLEQPLSIAQPAVLELGKYGLTASTAGEKTLTVTTGGLLTLASSTGTGEVETPMQLNGEGLLFAGPALTGDHIGKVFAADGTTPLYRLLVTSLPAIIPTGEHAYTFKDINGAIVSQGKFVVRDGVACLWLPQTNAGTLAFTLGKDYTTENVTINPDHFNIETYGVSDVAQIKNGKKYRKLVDALLDASGKTVVLLKNAVLETPVEISGSVVLETGEYSITAQDAANITVGAMGNLRITGTGCISTDITIHPSAPQSIYSNGNLQVDQSINLLSTSQIKLDGKAVYRVSVSGLPASIAAAYAYGTQSGAVKSSEAGRLCLWMNVSSTGINFSAEVGNKTYLATGVTIVATHTNPVVVTMVEGVAAIGGTLYDTLDDAFNHAVDGTEVIVRKDLNALAGTLEVKSGDLTLNLGGKTLTATTGAGLTLDASTHQLVIKSGTLSGPVAVAGNVYASGTVIMTNAYISQPVTGKTLWRTLVTLPPGTTTFDYSLGDTKVTDCKNIIGNVACLWLPSSNITSPFTVVAGNTEYVLSNTMIASTHGNELDVTAKNDPVATVDTKTFASLATAISEGIRAALPVKLLKPVTLSSIQDITGDLTIDMSGFNITSGDGGFNVTGGKTLTLKGSGMLLGTLRLPGKGYTMAGNTIKVAGIVLDNEGKEVYRTLVKEGTAVDAPVHCYWLRTATLDYDIDLSTIPPYQVNIPAGISNHNTVLTAYRYYFLSGPQTWKAEYAGANLELANNTVLTVGSLGTTVNINRLTIYDGARVVFSDLTSQVCAIEGIRYVRAFKTADNWQSVALPFTASRITAPDATGKVSVINPAYGSGTAGHFWLRTMDINGKLQVVPSAEMTANISYLMAVPVTLDDTAITFISGANQLLRREKLLAVKPTSGFASYANGTLAEVEVNEPCYLLNSANLTYDRYETAIIAPFRGYLLADATTTTITPELRLGTVTGNEAVIPAPDADNTLRVYGQKGRIVIEAERPTLVRIYTFTGYCVGIRRVPEGRTEVLLETNMYIVNNRKVWVK